MTSVVGFRERINNVTNKGGMKMIRIDNMSDRDKLWELYLHTLSGWHGNFGASRHSVVDISDSALKSAKVALERWNKDN
jgi:hypothetical protein